MFHNQLTLQNGTNSKIGLFQNLLLRILREPRTKAKEKIDFGLFLIQYVKQVPSKHIGSTQEKNLFYLRVKQGSNIFRIFFCYDEDKIVVIMNGFTKKTQKTPKNELERANSIKKQYFNEKQ